MKLLLNIFVMALISTSVLAVEPKSLEETGFKKLAPIETRYRDQKDVTFIFSTEKFSSLKDAEAFCKGYPGAQLAEFSELFRFVTTGAILVEKGIEDALSFSILDPDDKKHSGMIAWLSSNSETRSKKKIPESIDVSIIDDGHGSDESYAGIVEINEALAKIGKGQTLSVPAICVQTAKK